MKFRIKKILLLAFIALMVFMPADSSAVERDYPHYSRCEYCHYFNLYTLLNLIPQDIDDTQYNTLCRSCHIGGPGAAPLARTHSSVKTDTDYGDWTMECRVCHDPHQQRQFRVYGSESYLFSGNSDNPGGITATTLTDSGAGISQNLTGMVLIPNINNQTYNYEITGNTATTITVEKDMDLAFISDGDPYAVVYGNLLREDINLDDIMMVIYTGVSTDIQEYSSLVEQGANWTTDQYAGLVLLPDVSKPEFRYNISRNTHNTIIVTSLFSTQIQPGKMFEIITPNTGIKPVKFFRSTGAKSFADGDVIYDGICEVCHTQTTHFNNDGTAIDQLHSSVGYASGTYCIDCHKHYEGFKGAWGIGGSHPTHLADDSGPKLLCLACHGTCSPPEFRNLADTACEDLAATDVCDNCHSNNGVSLAKSYWSVPGSSTGTSGSWSITEGEESFCGSCHDATPGNTAKDGSGSSSYNTMGDNTNYGFYRTGHGLETGNYPRLAWQDTSAAGNPAGEFQTCGDCHGTPPLDEFGGIMIPIPPDYPPVTPCSFCHDITSLHFGSSNKRLRTDGFFDNDQNNTICKTCHSYDLSEGWAAAAQPHFYTNSVDYENSAHSGLLCTECHEVHGASGPFIAMTKADKEALCYQCHTEGGVVNNSISVWSIEGIQYDPPSFGDNQAILTDEDKNWVADSLIGKTIRNITDGSSGTITDNTTTTVTVSLSGGAENDWDNSDRYGILASDDIQEAFSQPNKHDLGSAFTLGGKNYALGCTTCHNVHIVTGRFQDADQGNISPVTRVSSPSNPSGNLGVWGDESGEKMNDYASSGSGTGGWFYNIARGYPLGSTSMTSDQSAVYRAPRSGSGYSSEFTGSLLPDYSTFCQDCHAQDMGGDTQGAIDWTAEKHGLSPSNMPAQGDDYYLHDNNTPGIPGDDYWTWAEGGLWGDAENPDPLFKMNYVSSGRGAGHFMRWPYDTADKSAGVNFVMACTDCHEAHGADRGGFVRERFNVNADGDCGTGTNIPDVSRTYGENCTDASDWTGNCNACHNSSGFNHEGQSCGTAASCHGSVDSPHRINDTLSSGTQLQLTADALPDDPEPHTSWDDYYTAPDFTPELLTVFGDIGSADLRITFRSSAYWAGNPGIFTNDDLSGSVVPGDFWLLDKNANNAGRTFSVTHTAGETTAIITMSQPLTESDLNTDLLAVRPASVWSWYDSGAGVPPNYNGTPVSGAVSAGPWPVQITADFVITKVEGTIGSDQLLVEFSKSAYANPGLTGDLQISDFNYIDASIGGAASISGVAHTAGASTAAITLDTALTAGDMDTDTLSAVASSVYNANSFSMPTSAVIVTAAP